MIYNAFDFWSKLCYGRCWTFTSGSLLRWESPRTLQHHTIGICFLYFCKMLSQKHLLRFITFFNCKLCPQSTAFSVSVLSNKIQLSHFSYFCATKWNSLAQQHCHGNNKVLILDVSISIRYCHTNYQDAMLCRFLSPPLNLYPGPWDCEKLLEPLRAWQPLHTRGSWPGNDF